MGTYIRGFQIVKRYFSADACSGIDNPFEGRGKVIGDGKVAGLEVDVGGGSRPDELVDIALGLDHVGKKQRTSGQASQPRWNAMRVPR